MKKWQHRVDADALPTRWPLLVDSTSEDDFVLREAVLQLQLDQVDTQSLKTLSARFGLTEAGLVLQAIMVFVHGRYLLVRMRRDRTGLFKGFPGDDPAPFSAPMSSAAGSIELELPHRLLIDLDSLAKRQSRSASALASIALHRFLSGHLDSDSRVKSPQIQ